VREVLLAGVLPTAATLAVATVILIERLQTDPSVNGSNLPLHAWFACALVFGVLHILGSWALWRGRATLADRLQRLLALALFIAACVLPSFGGIFAYALWALLAVAIMLYVLVLPLALVPFAPMVPGYLFGLLLALASAPALRSVPRRRLGRAVVFYVLACGFAALPVTWGSMAIEAVYNRTANSFAVPSAAFGIGLWLVACSMVWMSGLAAHRSLFLSRATIARVGAALLLLGAIAASCVMIVAAMVERRHTVFGVIGTRVPPALVDVVRAGRPPLDVPVVRSGRLFIGPFVSKSRTLGQRLRAEGAGMARARHRPARSLAVRHEALHPAAHLPGAGPRYRALPNDQAAVGRPDGQGHRAAAGVLLRGRLRRVPRGDPQRHLLARRQYRRAERLRAASGGLAGHGRCGAHAGRLPRPLAGASRAPARAAGGAVPADPIGAGCPGRSVSRRSGRPVSPMDSAAVEGRRLHIGASVAML
jgi:hypothetical protein